MENRVIVSAGHLLFKPWQNTEREFAAGGDGGCFGFRGIFYGFTAAGDVGAGWVVLGPALAVFGCCDEGLLAFVGGYVTLENFD